jgi:hypothetical protein
MRRINLRFGKRAFTLIGALGIGLVLVQPGATAARASQVAICGNNGTGYCLNDWNNGGNGSPVKMYWGNNSNEHFVAVGLTFYCNNGRVSASQNCPFSHHNLDQMFNNDIILEIQYSNGLCVAANGNADAVLGACPTSTTSPANGTVMVQPATPCATGGANGPSS